MPGLTGKQKMITAERLRQLLAYEQDTGNFRWLVGHSGPAQIGDLAGRVTTQGYCEIKIEGAFYKAHRLAILHVTGRLPDGEVDHRNGVRTDNRIDNLRVVNRSMNAQNLRKALSTNKSCGLLGVTWDRTKSRWKSSIYSNGKRISLGYFKVAEDAHSAYVRAKRAMHEGCTI